MAISMYPLRFFRVVSPLPPLIVWTFLILVSIAAITVANDPDRAAGAMLPVLLLQLFAASSGFEVPARRGHYDLLLTSGHARVWMAIMHWGSSIAPGIVAWLVLIVVERVASGGARASLLASGTCVAVWLVSTLPWAITVRLPRFSGGIGWLLALAISTSIGFSVDVPLGQSSVDAAKVVASAWSFLVYPAGLVGHELHPHEAAIPAPALFFACSSMVVACRWISRAGIPLEAAQ